MRQDHQIGRIRFEMSSPLERDLLTLRQQIEMASHAALGDALAAQLDTLSDPGSVLTVDRLEIDLGTLYPDMPLDLNALSLAVARALDAEVMSHGSAGGMDPVRPDGDKVDVRSATLAATRLEALLWYLQNGTLPAMSLDRDLTRLVAAIFDAPLPKADMYKTLTILHVSAPAALRLAFVLSGPQIYNLLHALPPGLSGGVDRVMAQSADTQRSHFVSENAAIESIAQGLRDIAGGLIPAADRSEDVSFSPTATSDLPSIEPEKHHETSKGNRTKEDVSTDTSPLPVADAGLVLLWPFLPHLFENLSINPRGLGALQGAHLLHFLAHGHGAKSEPDLMIARILLNIPGDVPLLGDAPLTDDMCAECDSLLQAVISHWNKLGTTSPDALRETFLQRCGLYDTSGRRPKLTLETRGVDVLLASVPWAMDQIMLPWCDGPLKVQWA